MEGLSIHGPRLYTNINVTGEGRLHAGDQINFHQTIYQGVSLSQQVIQAFGPQSRFLQIVGFAVAVVRATRTLLSPSEVEVARRLDIKELAYSYEWLEQSFKHEASHHTQCADHAASPAQAYRCQFLARSLLQELENLYIEEQAQIDRGSKCAAEKRAINDEIAGLRNVQHGYSRDSSRRTQMGMLRAKLDSLWIAAAQKTLSSGGRRAELERQLKAVTEINGPMSQTLLTLFWSKHLSRLSKTAALNDEEESVRLAEELADALTEYYRTVTDTILCDLAFEHMEARLKNIVEAYPDTYYWALADARSDGPGLRRWLTTSQGVYWITGKAGSGKSTLMKFLVSQEETTMLLKHWSNGHELVISSFYFWFAGTPLQKSTEGLLRSILHQIINERYALAKVAFPELFEESKSATRHTSWTESELFSAFKAIASHKVDSQTKKFCFFIDGLDEYHGNHGELVQKLALLVQNKDIKLCVASRPWNAFQKAYEHVVPNLRLEDLSQSDILRFVTQKIYAFQLGRIQSAFDDWDVRETNNMQAQAVTEAERDFATDSLIDLVVSRAEGVFLWVYLVVRSILEGLGEGDTPKILRRRVKTFPPDLRGFFRTIYERVDVLYREQTNQYLKLALLYMDDAEAGSLSRWLDFWLISEEASGLCSDTVYSLLEEPCDPESMLKGLRRSLNSCCRDLLVLPRSLEPTPSLTVTWLHRTVYDFIVAEQLTAIVDANVPMSFKNGEALHWIWLARWKFVEQDFFEPTDAEKMMSAVVKLDWSREHSLWSEKYAVTYDRLLHAFWGTFQSHTSPLDSAQQACEGSPGLGNIPANLVAYGQCRYVTNMIARLGSELDSTDPSIKPILLAAFGEHPTRPFRLSEIDVTLMRAMIRFNRILDATILQQGCTKSLWQLFWRKWALTKPAFTAEELARVWTVAKLLLQNPPVSDVCFCITTEQVPVHRHVHLSVHSFLNKAVPPEWLAEVKSPSFLESRPTKAIPKLARLFNPAWFWGGSET